jgi:hydroxypyruvate isomerase
MSEKIVQNGRIRQSVMAWCFKPMPAEELAKHCQAMGMPAIEGLDVKLYPQMRELGLDIAIVGSHGFKTGMCNPAHQEECLAVLRERIDLAVEQGYRRVITFTGMLPEGMSRKEAFKHCVDGFKQIAPHAEKNNVTLCIEHLNTRDDTHPMKGHPGYYGDDVDEVIEIIKAVGSPQLKLLFDVYHVQIMNGDVIQRIRAYHPYIGHYHTAGVPGRNELDDTQELNYPAIMKAIAATGYKGYVGQEYIPTWPDKIASLGHGVKVCDV